MKWYRKAAEQGHADAQRCLGGCYEEGDGVEQNTTEAVKWYRKAAEQGDPSAQYKLGECYLNGDGVEKNISEAKKWLLLASESDGSINSCAKELLEQIE